MQKKNPKFSKKKSKIFQKKIQNFAKKKPKFSKKKNPKFSKKKSKIFQKKSKIFQKKKSKIFQKKSKIFQKKSNIFQKKSKIFKKKKSKNLGRIVPLSERQQMALLKRIEENRKQATSPKPENPQVTLTQAADWPILILKLKKNLNFLSVLINRLIIKSSEREPVTSH